MKKLVLTIFIAVYALTTFGQILQPATWQFAFSDQQAEIGGEVELVFTVTLDDTWHLYTVDLDPDIGPLPTSFEFIPDASYELVGEITQIGVHAAYDDTWQDTVQYFSEKAEFRQKIKVLSKNLSVKVNYEFLICTTVDGMCIPGDGDYTFANLKVVEAASRQETKQEKKQKEEIQEPTPQAEEAIQVAEVITNSKDIDTLVVIEETVVEGESATTVVNYDDAASTANPETYSLWKFAILAFMAGLAGLLTPCVFPMIPMTVTFFSASSKNKSAAIRNAMIYGISIIAIYTIAGTVVAKINGPEFANWLSTHWVPNIFFFIIFVVFAMSFLGMFEITLPSALVNKVDKQADKGGIYGAFFMAFTLVLVSFSCTGPIVGSILVESAGGQLLKPIVGMFAFSLAFAIPFTLFAIFPEWLSRLPKSGGWLNSVKVVLGFLELALGLKFLSIADQVYHWGLLDREVYLAIWIVIFAMIGFYLLGKLRLAHDSVLEKIGVPRLMLAIASFTFVVYLIPGLFGAPLKGLAGYLPPMSTHDYNLPQLIAQTGNTGTTGSMVENNYDICGQPKYADMLHFPHGIKGYFDLEQGIACAKQQNKPIFIDFTGHGCVNCREMEARVWSDPEVLRRLKNDYIVVALYIDEKTELPESEWYTSTFDNKVKKSIGKQNADFQITRFNNNAQPFYVLMDYNKKTIIEPKSYDLDIQNFISFLDEGKARFNAIADAN